MKAPRYAIVLMLLGAFTLGCRASMVNRPGAQTSSPFDPVNEASRGGVIKYSNEGAAFVREKRRQNAYKQMHDACGGKYKIDAEGPRVDGGVVIPIGAIAIAASSESWYIQFSCVNASPSDSTQRQ
jgi:hypothetical protein